MARVEAVTAVKMVAAVRVAGREVEASVGVARVGARAEVVRAAEVMVAVMVADSGLVVAERVAVAMVGVVRVVVRAVAD